MIKCSVAEVLLSGESIDAGMTVPGGFGAAGAPNDGSPVAPFAEPILRKVRYFLDPQF